MEEEIVQSVIDNSLHTDKSTTKVSNARYKIIIISKKISFLLKECGTLIK